MGDAATALNSQCLRRLESALNDKGYSMSSEDTISTANCIAAKASVGAVPESLCSHGLSASDADSMNWPDGLPAIVIMPC